MTYNSFNEFEEMFNELGDKKIGELRDKDVGDDKVFYKYDKELLENLSYSLEEAIFKSIYEDLLYNNDLHTSPEELEEEDEYEF